MSRGRVVVGSVLAIAGLACREPKESPKPAPAAVDPSGSAQVPAIEAPVAPSLPADAAIAEIAPPAAAPTDAAIAPLVAFDAQPRDPAWAAKTEREIEQRFTKVRGGTLEATECRQSACRLTITGSEGDVGQTIADLESPRGMHGYARSITLTAPEKRPDGTLVLRAIANFER
jgi:hypothetical protein